MADLMLSTTEVFDTKIADKNPLGAQVLRSGQTFGWLRKKSRRFGICSYSPRFFTVDFDRRILYYSHSEFGKQISMYTPFCDIVDVERLKSSTSGLDEDGVRPRKSCLPCFPRAVKNDYRGFILHTKAKNLELRCSSESGAEKWVTIIKTAMFMGKEKLCNDEIDSEQSTHSCSRASSMACCTDGSEHSEEENAGEEVTEQFHSPLDSPLCKVPETNIAAPGRCLSFDTSLPPLLPDAQSTPSLPRDDSYSGDTELVGSPFAVDPESPLQASLPYCTGPKQHYVRKNCSSRFVEDDLAKSIESKDKILCAAIAVNQVQAPCAAVDDQVEAKHDLQACEAKDDLQALLVDTVMSTSATSGSHNAWKRPQQPIIENQPGPASPFEDSSFTDAAFEASLSMSMSLSLPTITEESATEVDNTPKASPKLLQYDIMSVTLRERRAARGVKIPADIQIP